MNKTLKGDSHKTKIIVSQIGAREYLLEGDITEAKFIAENNHFDVSCVDIKGGPKIVVGKDFFGHGSVDKICVLKTNPHEPLLLKVRLEIT